MYGARDEDRALLQRVLVPDSARVAVAPAGSPGSDLVRQALTLAGAAGPETPAVHLVAGDAVAHEALGNALRNVAEAIVALGRYGGAVSLDVVALLVWNPAPNDEAIRNVLKLAFPVPTKAVIILDPRAPGGHIVWDTNDPSGLEHELLGMLNVLGSTSDGQTGLELLARLIDDARKPAVIWGHPAWWPLNADALATEAVTAEATRVWSGLLSTIDSSPRQSQGSAEVGAMLQSLEARPATASSSVDAWLSGWTVEAALDGAMSIDGLESRFKTDLDAYLQGLAPSGAGSSPVDALLLADISDDQGLAGFVRFRDQLDELETGLGAQVRALQAQLDAPDLQPSSPLSERLEQARAAIASMNVVSRSRLSPMLWAANLLLMGAAWSIPAYAAGVAWERVDGPRWVLLAVWWSVVALASTSAVFIDRTRLASARRHADEMVAAAADACRQELAVRRSTMWARVRLREVRHLLGGVQRWRERYTKLLSQLRERTRTDDVPVTDRAGHLGALWNVSADINSNDAGTIRGAALASAAAAVRDGDPLQEPAVVPQVEVKVDSAAFDTSLPTLQRPVIGPLDWANTKCGTEWRFLHLPPLDLTRDQVTALRGAAAQSLGMATGAPLELQGGAGLGAGILRVAAQDDVSRLLNRNGGA